MFSIFLRNRDKLEEGNERDEKSDVKDMRNVAMFDLSALKVAQ